MELAGTQPNRELYIILSDLCNFSCSHCLNSSGPSAKRYRLSPQEVSQLIETVNSNSEITTVHFSGGEPTLHLGTIQEIQQRINRPVSWSITSNGSFIKRKTAALDAIVLDELVISFDRYRKPFITIEEIKTAIQYGLNRGAKVTLNYVYESLTDLAAASPLLLEGLIFKPSILIQSGRQTSKIMSTDHEDLTAKKGTCPSLENRKNGEKVIFIPGKGYTPCCGPLAFDELQSDSFLFSESYSQYSQNRCRSTLQKETFEQKLEKSRPTSRCDACQILHEPIGPNLPYLSELLDTEQNKTIYKTKDEAVIKKARKIASYFFCNATYSGKIKSYLEELEGHTQSIPTSIAVSPLSQETADEFIELYLRIYIQKHRNEFADHEVKRNLDLFPRYLSSCHTAHLYRKNGAVVGALLLNNYEPHPILGESRLHIGFIGYDNLLTSTRMNNDGLNKTG